jgi:hypothetical protein
MHPDDPIKATALAVGATELFGSSDTISKYLSGSLPIVEYSRLAAGGMGLPLALGRVHRRDPVADRVPYECATVSRST